MSACPACNTAGYRIINTLHRMFVRARPGNLTMIDRPRSVLHIDGVKTPATYDGLMERMASKLGVDLARAMVEGRLPPTVVNTMLQHCAACGDRGGCARWLDTAQQRSAYGFSHCPNRKLFISLRDWQTNGK